MPISTVLFLQVLYIVILIIHGEDSFDCAGYEDDSYHPIYDADDCRHYWHCIYVNTVYMHAVRRVCPAGTEFDVNLRKCETSSLVDCTPVISPHGPKTTTTTKAWKWKYSRLFSQKYWRTTRPYYLTTRRHAIFDLGDSIEDDTTTGTTFIPDLETIEDNKVLPFTLPQKPTNRLSLEQISKDLHALLINRRSSKKRPAAKFVQPGEPDNEAVAYEVTTQQPTRRTRYTTQATSIPTATPIPTMNEFLTTESMITTTMVTTVVTTTLSTITMTITAAAATTTATTTITITKLLLSRSTLSSTVFTQPDTPVNLNVQARMSGQKRRSNMTLYILTSGDHKIRRFSINHTRGILINCNQLRRRLLGRRRLRDIMQMTTDTPLMIQYSSSSSMQKFHLNILSLTILFFFFFTKIIIIT